MLNLYHCNTSYASQKTRLFLAEFEIPYEDIHIDLRKQEHITSDYRDINPTGTVPTLRDGDTLIFNSTDIMVYLSERYQRDEIIAFCRRHEALHDPYLRTLSYHHLFCSADERQNKDIDNIIAIASQHPNKARGEFLIRAARGEFTEMELSLAKQILLAELDTMEALLKTNKHGLMFGNSYSMADANATAVLFRMEKIGLLNEISETTMLIDYYQNMKSRPSFKKAHMC
tara:strand:- start:147951 stop:148637 length:687 start_codon:yes stop_codon:yes gene_type:complete